VGIGVGRPRKRTHRASVLRHRTKTLAIPSYDKCTPSGRLSMRMVVGAQEPAQDTRSTVCFAIGGLPTTERASWRLKFSGFLKPGLLLVSPISRNCDWGIAYDQRVRWLLLPLRARVDPRCLDVCRRRKAGRCHRSQVHWRIVSEHSLPAKQEHNPPVRIGR
jgi:hypothetical protein